MGFISSLVGANNSYNATGLSNLQNNQVNLSPSFQQALNQGPGVQYQPTGYSNAANQQQMLADQLTKAYQGQGPSAAQLQLQQGNNMASQQAAGQIASQRGMNPALQQRLIDQSQAQAMGQNANQSAQLRVQEQQNALANLNPLLVNMGAQGQQNALNAANVGLENYGAQTGRIGTIGGLQNQQNTTAVQNALGPQGINAQVAQGNQAVNAGIAGGLISSMGSAGGGMSSMGGGGGAGMFGGGIVSQHQNQQMDPNWTFMQALQANPPMNYFGGGIVSQHNNQYMDPNWTFMHALLSQPPMNYFGGGIVADKENQLMDPAWSFGAKLNAHPALQYMADGGMVGDPELGGSILGADLSMPTTSFPDIGQPGDPTGHSNVPTAQSFAPQMFKQQQLQATPAEQSAAQNNKPIVDTQNPYGGGFGIGSGIGNSIKDIAKMFMTGGGQVPGSAQVSGDSPKNDTVPAMLSPGEVVVPRSVASDPDAARDFIAHVKGLSISKDSKAGEKSHYAKVLEEHQKLRSRIEALEHFCMGGKAGY